MTQTLRDAAQALLDAYDRVPTVVQLIAGLEGLRDALSAPQPTADERTDALRRALEIIAVGDSKNPQAEAAEELIALGYWRDIPEARIPIQQPADERVKEHMRLAEVMAGEFLDWNAKTGSERAYDEAFAAVESSARALLGAGREDAELADFRRRVDAVCKQAVSTPGVPVPIDPEVSAEMHKLMRDEPSLFDRLAWGELKALAAIQKGTP